MSDIEGKAAQGSSERAVGSERVSIKKCDQPFTKRIAGCSRPKAKHFVETSRVGEKFTHVMESGVAA